MKLVIIGLGSIGKKHKQNLELLGHEIVPSFENVDGALVCNPTALHLETALKFTNLKMPVFIEKPLSHNLNGLDQLKGNILVGYCLRFNESLRKFKNNIPQKGIKSVKIVCQSWLPDWHPQTDYRQSYSAKKELGGGVLLDLSHEIDYSLWFFGPVKKVSARLQMSPELEIETEAIADLELEFISGIKADIHLSYASHQPARFCEIKTNNKTLLWNFKSNNKMYLEEMKHFIKVIQGKEKPLVTVTDGINVLKVIETAKINQL
ncbi:MAG: Gfo/Idh/MocA family oxidoreductase [Patescibacteria group bacterium]|nr:Gfo/Idh/MocA family oxidoreductase [Patescibacteria group bacterium]